MPKQKVSEEFIIKESLKLFRKKSYHNTSMADIAEACGLLKGSIYHHFPSKEQLMKAVITYVHQFFKDNIFIYAYDDSLKPLERLQHMFKKSEKMYLSDEGGDLLGNVGVETARIIPEFSELIRDFFVEWISAKQHILQMIMPADEAKIFAEQMVAEIEGAIMMTRIFRSPSFMKNTYKRLLSRIENQYLVTQNQI
jgi:TetR/AcrR family transcriptional repressor of nem operon